MILRALKHKTLLQCWLFEDPAQPWVALLMAGLLAPTQPCRCCVLCPRCSASFRTDLVQDPNALPLCAPCASSFSCHCHCAQQQPCFSSQYISLKLEKSPTMHSSVVCCAPEECYQLCCSWLWPELRWFFISCWSDLHSTKHDAWFKCEDEEDSGRGSEWCQGTGAGGPETSREEAMIDGSHLCPTGMGLCKWRIRETRWVMTNCLLGQLS